MLEKLSEERLIHYVTSADDEVSMMAVELLKFRKWAGENWPLIDPLVNHPFAIEQRQRQQGAS